MSNGELTDLDIESFGFVKDIYNYYRLGPYVLYLNPLGYIVILRAIDKFSEGCFIQEKMYLFRGKLADREELRTVLKQIEVLKDETV